MRPRRDDSAPQRRLERESLTLALSVRLRSLLAARGISVVTTRESDTAIAPCAALKSQSRRRSGLHQPACLLSGAGVHLYASSCLRAAVTFLPWKTAQPLGPAQPGARRSAELRLASRMSVNLAYPASLVDSMAARVAVESRPTAHPIALPASRR